MDIGLNVKCPLFLSDFNNQTWIWLTDFSKDLVYKILQKPVQVGAELFHVDRWINRHDKANSHIFQLFCKHEGIHSD
jgi:hypothetical protein